MKESQPSLLFWNFSPFCLIMGQPEHELDLRKLPEPEGDVGCALRTKL
jgi:hypothetical protein